MESKHRFQEATASQCEWITKNIAHNLDFVPDDKLDWKPAPEASSVLEIVAHLLAVFAGVGSRLQGGDGEVATPVPATREEARQGVLRAGREYALLLRAMPDERLGETAPMRMGALPVSLVMTMPVLDAMHHHGQIAYIQTLLGDAETHFDMASFAT